MSARNHILQPLLRDWGRLLRGLFSTAGIAVGAILAGGVLIPSYNNTMPYIDEAPTSNAADHLPLSVRLAYASLTAAGHLTLTKDESFGRAAAVRNSPFNEDVNRGSRDFVCAAAGNAYLGRPIDNIDGFGTGGHASIDIASLTISIVAAEMYNRGPLRRSLEFLYVRSFNSIFGNLPDVSLGVSQLRPSTLKEILYSNNVVFIEDESIINYLEDRCESIKYSSILISRYLSGIGESDLSIPQIIEKISIEYIGGSDVPESELRLYTNVIKASYVILTGIPQDKFYDRFIVSEEDYFSAFCVPMEPGGLFAPAVWTQKQDLQLGPSSPFEAAAQETEAEEKPFTISPAEATRYVFEHPDDSIIAFYYYAPYSLPKAFPDLDRAQTTYFRLLLRELGVPEKNVVQVRDRGLLSGCGDPATPTIAFVVLATPASRSARPRAGSGG